VHAGGVQASYLDRYLGAAQYRRQPQLVTAGDENAAGAVELLDVFGAFGVGALGNGQGDGVGDADLVENLDIAIAGIFQAGCGRDDSRCAICGRRKV
jgi:hypothetical protein